MISLEQPPGGTWDHQILRGLQPLLQERDYALIMHDASYNGTRAEPEVPFDERDMDALIVDGHAATDEYLRQDAVGGRADRAAGPHPAGLGHPDRDAR